MSATSRGPKKTPGRDRGPRPDDPRVLRTRAAVVGAARTLFLTRGYGGTTMEDIAAAAGLARRTLYNNYQDKDALFTEIVAEVTGFAAGFARNLDQEFKVRMNAANLRPGLHDLGQRLALAIVRPEVIALRRLLIGEARTFPALARKYFEQAPGQVLVALAAGFRHLGRVGLLEVPKPGIAAEHFAYLVAGAPLDRAILVGTIPSTDAIVAGAREGTETFLARYVATPGRRKTRS